MLTACSGSQVQADGGSNPAPSEKPFDDAVEVQDRTLFVFDTVVTLSCSCSEELMERAVERCQFFEERFSRAIEGSDVWNVNHAGGKPVDGAGNISMTDNTGFELL